MVGSKSPGLPHFDSTQELVEFFDAHDLGECIDQMPEAHFEVDLRSRRYLVEIDQSLLNKLSEISQSNHISVEALVNSWLREKVLEINKGPI